MNIQFLISFKDKKGDSARSKIRIFYSLRKRHESWQIISSIMEKLRGSFSNFEWEICDFFGFICNLKYMGIYFSSQPIIFMEIDNLKLEEQEVLQDLMAKILIMLKGDSVPSIKNDVSPINKSQLPSAKRRKKQKRKANPLLPPPEGPVFQFVPLAEGGEGFLLSFLLSIKSKQGACSST
ncbi:MAG: hypothetical protein ACOX2N_02000 [Peptococcia bacterium]